MRSALEIYGRALADGSGLGMLDPSGALAALPLHVWTSAETPGDAGLLGRCRGPVLDVGCGPGRLAAGLMARGVPALGVDICSSAVAMARARGATALIRSVYERLPGEGRWTTVLLADGNVGIGGDPVRLLHRVRELLAPDGVVLVELHPGAARSGRVRLEGLGCASGWFRWAFVGPADVDDVAGRARLSVAERWSAGGRLFAALRP